MIKYFLSPALIIFSILLCSAGERPLTPAVQKPSTDSLMESIVTLSSAPFAGRKTGTIGQKNAANFISDKLLGFGIKPLPHKTDFIQHHSLSLRSNSQLNIEVHQRFYLYLDDYFYIRGYQDTSFILQNILFLGYGISDPNYDDYSGINVKDKAILIYEGEPPGLANKMESRKESANTSWTSDWKKKLAVIYEKKPLIAFIITKNVRSLADSLLDERKVIEFYQLARSPQSIPIVFISEEMAVNFFPEYQEYLFDKTRKRIDTKTRPSSFSVSSDAVIPITSDPSQLSGENVMGMIEGDQKKEEYIIISAHYDHLGEKDSLFYPGADDNASGTAAVLELARLFIKAVNEGEKQRRSVVFTFFSGEEDGLLGSSYFVRNLPVPLESIVANLNIDMLGRTDNLHDSLNIQNYTYIIGADRLSDELFRINERCNEAGPKLLLNYKYDEPDDPNRFYYRSDHYHFAKNNIPVVFYFSGVHADYHKLTDTFDKIDSALLAKRTQLVYFTAWQLANEVKRIKSNKRLMDSQY